MENYKFMDDKFMEDEILEYCKNGNYESMEVKNNEKNINSMKNKNRNYENEFKNFKFLYSDEYISDLLKKNNLEREILLKDEKHETESLAKNKNSSVNALFHDLMNDFYNLEKEMIKEDKNHKAELLEKDSLLEKEYKAKLLEKDLLLEKEQYKNKMKNKDIELLQLKLQLANMKK